MIKKIILTLILILTLTSLILAQDSYKNQGNQIVFTIEAPKEGIYGQAYLYQNATRLTTLKLCGEMRCYSKFQTSINPQNFSLLENTKYTLLYYDFQKFIWKNISFQTLAIGAGSNINANAISESKPLAKRTTISIICSFYTLFDSQEYTRCKQEYLNRV